MTMRASLPRRPNAACIARACRIVSYIRGQSDKLGPAGPILRRIVAIRAPAGTRCARRSIPMLEQLVALVVPPRCAACRAPGRRAADVLCGACRRALPWLGTAPCCPGCALPLPHRGPCPARDAPFEAAWSAVAYEGVARDAMHALKFSAARPLAEVMAAQIVANAPAALLHGQLVAVPPHPVRRRTRGFDPADLLARALARRTGLPLAANVLRRGAAPSRQLGASLQTRRDAARLRFRSPRRGAAPRDPRRRRPHDRGDAEGVRRSAARRRRGARRGHHMGAHAVDEEALRTAGGGRSYRCLARQFDREDPGMQIEVKGRNVPVNDELRELVERKFRKVAAQVSDLARMEVELREERNPAIAESQVAAVTLYLKGVTLHAEGASREQTHAIKLCSVELARQVKRHEEKKRRRREARSTPPQPAV